VRKYVGNLVETAEDKTTVIITLFMTKSLKELTSQSTSIIPY